ncbi:relaxase/mobilization nuclease domain-containing protein [Rathayibacter sp. SD072]|uniref:relaxase/mobilization nuclease domain-containing protein n=1 Tax=Rathayibacter sp. SD072 TaxID=2781731 RepID=UPI001A96734A|nr:relaxase [Rathayibacter sp. SD072]MBO0982683.1 relaxase [Rathayibacter sp. SD072]
MIAKVTRGARMGGLMTYLVGPGNSNEHTEQHLVAGDSAVMTMYGYDSLDRATALEIAASLEAPRREFGVEVSRQVTRLNPGTGETLKERVDASVWHCSLSLAAEEGLLSDEKWGQIAQEFVDRMGFTEVSGKAACRWVAVRHGLSTNGNDHVHIAVALVREDGTKASTHNDFHRAMNIVRELETEFDLQPLRAEREQDMPQRQESRAARESAHRRGAVEVDATRLERTVRAAASASMDEAEFVRRMRREGVLIRPRFETGRNDVVTGYSVALRPEKGAQPVWHSGLRLARDLTLPELRKSWPDTPETASAAVGEWRATRKNPDRYVPVQPGREESEMNPQFFTMFAEDMTRLHEYISQLDPGDYATWAHVARETSGAYAAWSRRLETTPGPLAQTSRVLARSAQLSPSQSRPRPVAMPSMVNTTALILAQATKGKNAAAEALLLRQLSQTTVSIFRAAQAAGDARRAQELARAVTNNLRAVRDSYAAQIAENNLAALTPEERAVKQRADLAAGRGRPLPTKLTPTAQPELAQPAPRTTGATDCDAHER